MGSWQGESESFLYIYPEKTEHRREYKRAFSDKFLKCQVCSSFFPDAAMEDHESLTSLLQKVLILKNESCEPEECGTETAEPQSLVNLSIRSLAQHSGDDFLVIKMTIAAYARRRKLLNDELLIQLAGSSWEILDVSGSDVSDFGLTKVVKICKSLRAVDISRCRKISEHGVSELLQNCHSLETLRFGGCSKSNYTARRCLEILKIKIPMVERDSWEEFDGVETSNSAHSLRWIVWPEIDEESSKRFAAECPHIGVNPNASLMRSQGMEIPRETLMGATFALDEPFLKGIEFKPCGVFKAMSHKKVKDKRRHMHHPRRKNLGKETMNNQVNSSISQESEEDELFVPEIPAIVEQYEKQLKYTRASKKKKKDRRARPDFDF